VVIVPQENRGLSGARNTGLTHAKGTYIQFCDPDDYYMPDMCEKLHDAISSSGADLAVAGARVFYDQIQSMPGDKEYFRVKGKGLTTVNEAVFRNTDVCSWNKIYKKSIIDTFSINFPIGLCNEDTCFFYKYLFVSKTIYYVPEYLYSYIRHDGTIMSKIFEGKTPRALDFVKILEDIKSFMTKNNLNDIYETDVFVWIITLCLHNALLYGAESTHDPIVKIVSGLLADIPDGTIQSCPYISRNEIVRLMTLKNDTKTFLKIMYTEPRPNRLKRMSLFFFPARSWRRNFARRIYRRLSGKQSS
jgi:glycosyltransferase involved in cell wall biosynthesis